MNTGKRIISLLLCMLMVLSIVPMSVFAVEATEIDTINIEGIPAPLYGQTVGEYYTAILDERGGGTLTVNDETFNKSAGKYGNLFDEGLEVKKNDTVLSSTSTELITEGNYYVAMTLYPADGYAIPADVVVTVDGAVSVETDFDEYGSLIVYAEYEVKATEIDTVNIEGVPAPVYGQTVKEYNTVMYNGSMDGTHKINGSTRVNNDGDIIYGNIELADWEYYNSEKSYLAPSSADALPSVYYLVHWLNPAAGYKFPNNVDVTVDGAVSVETELDEDGCLAVWAKFEVKPTEIDTVNLTYDLDYIDLNTFYNEYSVTDRAREALATDTAGIKIGYGNCCVSYIDSNGNYYNCTYPSKEIIAEKDYYIRAVLMLEDGYDWPTAAKTDEPSGLKIISNGTDISDTVYIKYRSDLNWIIVYAKIGKPSTEPIISGVSISDSAIMLDKGESHSFIVDVYGNADDKTVTWTVEGNVSVNTTVDGMGKLTIGADETADEITVKATSKYNSKKFVAAKVKIGTPTEIDTVQIEGVPAPLYGQTVKAYYEAIQAKIDNGTITVNDEVYDSANYKYGNLLDDNWNVRSEADGLLNSTSTDLIKEGTYYVAMWFYPDIGYVIPEDVNVIFDGAKSVKIEVDSDGCLDIRAEFEVKAPAPTEIDTINIEGVPAPKYGQTVEEYYTAILDERGGGTLTVNDETFNKSAGKYGNLFDEGLEVKKNDTVLDPTSTELITEGNYYVAMTLYPADGYVIPADVAVTVDGAVSVETDFDEYGSLIAYAKYEVKATEIDTVHIEGVLAPQYGQTIKSYYEAIEAKITDGTITVNDEVYDSTEYKYGNLLDDGWNVRSEADDYLSSTSTDLIKEGTYYVAMWFYPDLGYVIPEDVNVLFDGAKSVKIELEDDGCLDIRAEYEVKATEIDTINIEGVLAPQYGDTVQDHFDDMIKKGNDGEFKVNGLGYYVCDLFDDMGFSLLDKDKKRLDKSEVIVEGIYYFAMEFLPSDGYVIPNDVAVKLDGALSVETEFDEDGWLTVWAKFEVKCPHTYDNACDAECNICKAPRTPAAHKGGTATCTTKAKCTVCGAEYGSLASHKEVTLAAKSATYTSTGLTAGKKCSVCGKITVAQQTVAKLTLGKVDGLKAKKVKVAKKSEITLSWNSLGDGVKYEVYIKNGKKWTKLTTTSKTSYTVKKDGKKKYLKADKEYQFRVRAVVDDIKGKYSSTLKVETIPSTATLKLKSGSKQLTASWSKVSDISGYEVQYSTSKKFSKKTTKTVKVKKSSKNTTVKKLKKGKKYYVRIRTYKTVDGKKIYSSWSKVKNVKVK